MTVGTIGTSSPIVEKVWPMAKLAAQQNGCELYDVEFVGGSHGRILRIFIDREGGVSVENCEAVSRTMNLHLDVEDAIAGGAYNLEVSSPGLDRNLKRPEHFQSAIGKEIQLRTRMPMAENNQRQFKGVLLQAGGEGIELELPDKKLIIPYENIDKAKVVFNFETNKQPKKN